MTTENIDWKPEIADRNKPAYLAIADALAADIALGRLRPGQRLPPQRALADLLGLDLTTVSRAYGEARRRGLLDARVGQGTFVCAAPAALGERAPATAARFVDMGMNQPPLPAGPEVTALMRRGVAAMAAALRPEDLLHYPDAGEQAEHRAAGALWLRRRLPEAPAERILVCPGSQSALLALLATLAQPGDTVCAEALTYPGFKAVAAQLGLRVVGVAMDGDGVIPEALAAAFTEHQPKAFYCIPTLNNPTTATLPLARRHVVADLARRHGVPILEDDIYGPLASTAPPPLATLAPELVWYIGSLAKCLSPVLRIAYVLAPDGRQWGRLAAALRASALIASPLTAAVARQWLRDGTAGTVLAAIRDEAAARSALALETLPPGSAVTNPEAFHLWLRLPAPWSRNDFAARLRTQGVVAATSDAFATTPDLPEALRVCLGAPRDRGETQRVLDILAETLDQYPADGAAII